MSGSIRDRYVRPLGNDGSEDSSPHETESHLEPYEAFDRGQAGPRRESGVKLYYEDGVTQEVLFYGYILRAISTDESHITITSTEGVYLIEGQNLSEILDQLQDQKLRFLRAYNGHIHAQPAANAPIIYRIEYLTNADWAALVRARNEVRPTEDRT